MSSMLDLPHPDAAQLIAGLPAQQVPAFPGAPVLRAVPDLDEPPLDFDDVVRHLTPRLQRYATRRLGDSHEAEELVQEALLRAFNHRDELRTEDDVAAWTTCVTGRLVIDRLRVRGRSTSMAEVPEGTRVGRDTADVVVARDEARLALDALDAMPPRQAAVLWAREVEGLAYEAIGERFGMTEPAVRSVLMRARKGLRKEFATRGGTLPAGGLVALAPWLDGLTMLDRLRRMVGKAAAPAAIGAASLGLIGGGMLPWGSGPETAVSPEHSIVTAQDVSSARPVLFPSAGPAVEAAAVERPQAVSAQAPTAPVSTVVGSAPLHSTCASASAEQGLQIGSSNGSEESAGAGGAGCAPVTGTTLYIGPELPANPSGITRVGVDVGRQGIDCASLPTVPMTQCTEGERR